MKSNVPLAPRSLRSTFPAKRKTRRRHRASASPRHMTDTSVSVTAQSEMSSTCWHVRNNKTTKQESKRRRHVHRIKEGENVSILNAIMCPLDEYVYQPRPRCERPPPLPIPFSGVLFIFLSLYRGSGPLPEHSLRLSNFACRLDSNDAQQAFSTDKFSMIAAIENKCTLGYVALPAYAYLETSMLCTSTPYDRQLALAPCSCV